MKKGKSWPGIDPGTWEHAARRLAEKQRERLSLSSERLEKMENVYVAWLDLMGAGNLMTVSVHKTANAIARIHLAVHYACRDHSFQGDLLPINDGVFILSKTKSEIMTILRAAMVMLAGNFIARPKHPERFLVRSSIAYGPVCHGRQLSAVLDKQHITNEARNSLKNVMFGPPIIQAYHGERLAPPFGIAIHESARAFSANGEEPFRAVWWLWWQSNDDGAFPTPTPQALPRLKDILMFELRNYFAYLPQ